MPGREDRAQLRLAEHDKRPYTTRRFITARAPGTSLWASSSRKTLQVSLFYRRWVFLYDTDHLRYQVVQVDNATRRFRADRVNTFSSQKIGRLMGWEKARAIRLTTDKKGKKKREKRHGKLVRSLSRSRRHKPLLSHRHSRWVGGRLETPLGLNSITTTPVSRQRKAG